MLSHNEAYKRIEALAQVKINLKNAINPLLKGTSQETIDTYIELNQHIDRIIELETKVMVNSL